jgi:phosphoglycolate phosphatase-like HAD superfamily hydrolase
VGRHWKSSVAPPGRGDPAQVRIGQGQEAVIAIVGAEQAGPDEVQPVALSPRPIEGWYRESGKPDPEFFQRVVEAAPYESAELLYVGDRLDNDIRPAAACGLHTALIRRGPWGMIQQHDPDVDRIPTMRIDSLAEPPGRVAEFNAAVR